MREMLLYSQCAEDSAHYSASPLQLVDLCRIGFLQGF